MTKRGNPSDTAAAAAAPRRLRSRAAFVLALLVAATLPSGADAGLSSWDTLATDLPRTVRGIDVQDGTGWAVGDGGLILRLDGDTWIPHESPTTRDLADVAVHDATRAVAVGSDGLILEYGPQSDGSLAWGVAAAAGSLGIEHLHAAAFLGDTPLAAGTGGSLVIGQSAEWVVRTVTSGRTFHGLDVKDNLNAAYLVGSATGGDSGAIMYRYLNGNWNQITIPTGTYGLHDIDIQACRAVGSGGKVLRCVDGNPSTWVADTIAGGPRLEHIVRDPFRTGKLWTAGTDSSGDGVLYHTHTGTDSGTWQSRILPTDGPVTGLAPGLNGIIVGILDQIVAFRPHPPTFHSMPTSTTGYQGETIRVPFSAGDEDGDQLIPQVIPDPDLPPDVTPPDVRKIVENIWEMIWIPPYDLEGIFDFKIEITDGDFVTRNGTKIIILDQNAPPYWDPQPDVVIPYGLPYTTQAQAYDPDNDPLTLTGPVIPPGSVFQDLGGGLAQLDWTPTAADVGTHFLTFTADDGQATGDLDFEITVVDNEPPVIDWHTLNGTICVAGPFHSGIKTFRAGATDPEGGPLTYEWTFHDDNTIQTGQPVHHKYTTIGNHLVTLIVTDDVGLTDSAQITVRVDDCITLIVEPDQECYDITDRIRGVLRLFGHDGQGISGTYTARIEWENALGQPKHRIHSGTIKDGFAFYDLPYDNDPLPLNDHDFHRVYFKAFYPNSPLGDTEYHAVTVDHYVSYHCQTFKEPRP